MTTIILTRHGHVEGIHPPRFRGQHPVPLTDQGREEAGMVARRIASCWRPAAVLTSPLARCIITGGIIAETCQTGSRVEEGLLDLHYGEWQWQTHEDVKERWPHPYAQWHSAPHLVRFPRGESLQDIVLRTADVFRRVLADFPKETVVLVGHDSVNRAMLLQLLDQPLSAYWKLVQDPCCINVIECEHETIRVVRINDTQHIERAIVRPAKQPASAAHEPGMT
ncbi:MAG: histidine phosphatase family protein [Bosea sp. (in: a-proteobacteria)]|uniref:histidine phosphatase family protein n=1 Tax=Bosea sp. (in: a-proteobacteria) TaxID=1871050 RepID=UPI003F7C289E